MYGIDDPTVISVWFEKKQGQDYKVIQPSLVYGAQATLVVEALHTLNIPAHRISDKYDMLYQLILKNLYILTTNITGLVVGGEVNTLFHQHQDLTRQIADEILDIQDWLTDSRFNRDRLWSDFRLAIEGDLKHKCRGRSANQRLENAIRHADSAALRVPTLRDIYSRQG
jgi:hypothetical protein